MADVQRSTLHGGLVTLWLLAAVLFYYWGDVPFLPAPVAWAPVLDGLAYHEVGFVLLAVPVVYASVVFRTRGAIAVSVAATGAIVPHTLFFTSYPDPFFRLFSFAAISLLLGVLIGILLNGRERLQRQHRSLARFVSETLTSQEAERRYLARELHDETTQELVDVLHEIDDVQDLIAPRNPDTSRRLGALRASVEQVIEGTRRFMQGLRPPQLDELGLGPSLRWLCDQVAEESGIEVTISTPEQWPVLPNATELAVYRMVQEALTNARRHSQATAIDVEVAATQSGLRVEVRDNGVGFTVPEPDVLTQQGKFGLIGLLERARLVGGAARVQSTPGKRTNVAIEVPSQPWKSSFAHDNQPPGGLLGAKRDGA